jgi:fluoride exporter
VSAGTWCLVATAGALGALLRYVLDQLVTRRISLAIPAGTLAVNVSGSLVLGTMTGIALYHAVPATLALVVGPGFCGGYTTFSTFSYETLLLGRDGPVGAALAYVAASVVLCALAAAGGLAIGALL